MPECNPDTIAEPLEGGNVASFFTAVSASFFQSGVAAQVEGLRREGEFDSKPASAREPRHGICEGCSVPMSGLL
jgi:hypothetical protein